MNLPPQGTRTLVLNANMNPIQMISYEDAFTRIFKTTECLDCNGRRTIEGDICELCNGTGQIPSAVVMETYDYCLRDGKGIKHLVPAVIRNSRQVKVSFRLVNYSTANILKRDNYTCQYCGAKQGEPGVILEMEHVVPRSRWNGSGTPTCWTNIVAACRKCNRKKADFFVAHEKDAALESKLHVFMPLMKEVNGRRIPYKKPKAPREADFDLVMDFKRMKRIPEEWLPYIDHLLG